MSLDDHGRRAIIPKYEKEECEDDNFAGEVILMIARILAAAFPFIVIYLLWR